jgi:hypothetical protein
MWGLGDMSNTTAVNKFLPGIRGYRFRFDWKEWETARGTFTNSALQSEFNKAITNNLYIDFQVFVAPTDVNTPNDNNTPLWLFSAPDSVPLVETNDATIKFFPYYFNANYKTRYFNFLDHILSLMVSQTNPNKAFFLSWESAEGTTGDTGPYKGNPLNNAYNISDNAWSDFKRDEVWIPYYNAYAAQMPNMRVSINPGNDGENFQWALDNIPNAWLKQGHPTHTYSLSGELFYVNRLKALAESSGSGLNNRVYGEFENTLNLSWWEEADLQNFFAMLCSVCHHYIDMLNISSANSQSLVNNDMTAYNFVNKYMGVRTPQESTKAFLAFRMMIDLADTTKWSEGTYGNLIASGDLSSYNTKKNNILSSGDPQTVIDQNLTDLLVDGNTGNTTYVNPARITALRAAFPDAEWHVVDQQQQQDAYNQEFGIYLIPDNYQRWLTQFNPEGTSEGVWKIGPTNQLYGRYARQFKITGSSGEMFFTLDPDLAFTGGDLKISITYYDNSDGRWSLNVATSKGKSEIMVNQNKGTNTFITKSVTSSCMVLGGQLAHSSDITLKYLGDDNTSFVLMEVEEV